MLAKCWPASVLPVRVMFHPDIPSQSGGASALGSEQIVASSAGRWKATMGFVIRPSITTARSRDRLLAARAMLSFLKGRTNGLYIGPFDGANSPSGLAGAGSGPIITPHDDDTPHDDGAGYSQPSNVGSLASDTSEGDLSVSVTMITAYGPEAGQYFGFGSNELYLIDSSVHEDDGSYSLTFWPPLRSDHAAAEEINFDDPTCLMRLASDDSGQLALERFFQGQQELSLVEAI